VVICLTITTMFDRILPRSVDNTYRGNKLALWLFGLFVLMQLVIGVNSIVNGHAVLMTADGIPLDTLSGRRRTDDRCAMGAPRALSRRHQRAVHRRADSLPQHDSILVRSAPAAAPGRKIDCTVHPSGQNRSTTSIRHQPHIPDDADPRPGAIAVATAVKLFRDEVAVECGGAATALNHVLEGGGWMSRGEEATE
jgi:hypothetical protein